MPLPVAVASRNITYFFSDDATTDEVVVRVSTETVNPFTESAVKAEQSVSVFLPSNGWDDADVLAALQTALPQFTVEWANG